MRPALRLPALVLAAALSSALAAAARAAPPAPGEQEGCGVCHGAERVRHEQSVHRSGDIGCASCHGGDPSQVESKEAAHSKEKGFLGRISRQEVPLACGRCHADVTKMRPYGLRADVLDAYRSSQHGKAVLGKGDAEAATCTDCHGAHDVRPVRDPRSPAFRTRVPATCGKCHSDAALMKRHGLPADAPRDFAASVHGMRLAGGVPGVPSCADCHDAHAATPPGADEVAAVCGTCHRDALETFRQSPHLSASRRGEMKQCITCHGNHAVSVPGFELFLAPPRADRPAQGGSRCSECHAAGEKGAAVANAFGTGLRDTDAAVRAAASRVDEVAAEGYFVDDERDALEQARRELVAAVPLTHSMDLPRVEATLRRSRSFVSEALAGVDGRRRETRDRRILGSFTAVVLLGIAGFLTLRRRRAPAGTA